MSRDSSATGSERKPSGICTICTELLGLVLLYKFLVLLYFPRKTKN